MRLIGLIMRLETIKQIYEVHKNPVNCTYRSNCHICSRFVEIHISKTSGGYGLLGGILHEQGKNDIIAICVNCYEEHQSSRQVFNNNNKSSSLEGQAGEQI